MLIPPHFIRLVLLSTIAAGVALGLAVPGHSSKILVSGVFGVCAGMMGRHCFRRARQQDPERMEQVRRNAAEAQEMLRDSFSWKLGTRRPMPGTAASFDLEEMLSDVVAIVLFVCLAAMVWVLPVFWEPVTAAFVPYVRAAGAHLFALCSVAFATFGVMTRLSGQSRRGP